MGTEKVEKNVIFYYLVKVKREEKGKYGAWSFYWAHHFFFSPNHEEKIRENGNEKKNYHHFFYILLSIIKT